MIIYTLYVKTHNKTGLQYLGQTKNEPYSYQGSGKYWQLHIKKHGYDVDTKILQKCYTKSALKAWGIFYSDLWRVVESNKWANLKPESGDGGGGKMTDQALAKQAATFARKTPEERALTKSKRSASVKKVYAEKTPEEKAKRASKISKSNMGRIISAESRAKNSSTFANKSKEEKEDIAGRIAKALSGRKIPQETLDKRAATIASRSDEERKRIHGSHLKGKPWPEARRNAQIKKAG